MAIEQESCSARRVVAIIQARMGSTRLPGKILKPLGDKSVLAHVVSRVQTMAGINDVVVATTSSAIDDFVVREAKRCGVIVFRGSEGDVLDRYYHAAASSNAEVVVRVTSDCPLIDVNLGQNIISEFLHCLDSLHPLAYLSNTVERSFPRGFDTEVFSFTALEAAWRNARTPAEREHVTPYLYRHPELFRQKQYRQVVDQSHFRLTLDTPEDYALLKAIFEALGSKSQPITGSAVLQYLEAHPEIVAINAAIAQKPLGY